MAKYFPSFDYYQKNMKNAEKRFNLENVFLFWKGKSFSKKLQHFLKEVFSRNYFIFLKPNKNRKIRKIFFRNQEKRRKTIYSGNIFLKLNKRWKIPWNKWSLRVKYKCSTQFFVRSKYYFKYLILNYYRSYNFHLIVVLFINFIDWALVYWCFLFSPFHNAFLFLTPSSNIPIHIALCSVCVLCIMIHLE